MAAAGPKSMALHYCREWIAESSWFQTWVGAGDLAEARAQIVRGGRDDEELPDRPWVMLRSAPEQGLLAESVGVGTHVMGGVIELIVEADIDGGSQNDSDAAQEQAENEWGEFLQDMSNRIGQAVTDGVRPDFRRPQETQGPEFPDKDAREDHTKRYEYWMGKAEISWGAATA